jgi:hypothetical protein
MIDFGQHLPESETIELTCPVAVDRGEKVRVPMPRAVNRNRSDHAVQNYQPTMAGRAAFEAERLNFDAAGRELDRVDRSRRVVGSSRRRLVCAL